MGSNLRFVLGGPNDDSRPAWPGLTLGVDWHEESQWWPVGFLWPPRCPPTGRSSRRGRVPRLQGSRMGGNGVLGRMGEVGCPRVGGDWG